MQDVPLIVRLLELFSPNEPSNNGQHASKRLKTMTLVGFTIFIYYY